MGNMFHGMNDIIAKSWIAKNELQRDVIIENLMCGNVPGYKAKRVCFENEFLSQLAGAHAQEIDERCFRDISEGRKKGKFVFSSRIEQDKSTSARKDGNNVDKTKEEIDLATLEAERQLRNEWTSNWLKGLETVVS
ncbi:hypothetical protein FACS1894198_2100 [Clostridia bacterium]|nr:hypothetical protein FACS1894198_2100 [Clostridia bacterium]